MSSSHLSPTIGNRSHRLLPASTNCWNPGPRCHMSTVRDPANHSWCEASPYPRRLIAEKFLLTNRPWLPKGQGLRAWPTCQSDHPCHRYDSLTDKANYGSGMNRSIPLPCSARRTGSKAGNGHVARRRGGERGASSRGSKCKNDAHAIGPVDDSLLVTLPDRRRIAPLPRCHRVQDFLLLLHVDELLPAAIPRHLRRPLLQRFLRHKPGSGRRE